MIDPAPGILLISDPFLKDPNFMRSVILLCDHHDNGSFGFVLNRKYENTLDELIPELESHTLPVFYGGPVQKDTIHFIHQYPDQINDAQKILPGIYWGGNFEDALELIKSNRYHPDKIRFFIGYSGWGNGQLSDELIQKNWLTVKAKKSIVFTKNCTDTWKESLKHLGGDYEIMVNFPIDPQLN